MYDSQSAYHYYPHIHLTIDLSDFSSYYYSDSVTRFMIMEWGFDSQQGQKFFSPQQPQ
jgi:hypothetical protein